MEKPSLDSPLIPGHTEVLVSGADGANEAGPKSGGEFFVEIKRQLSLAGPLIASSLLQNILQVISVMFVGHLGELALSGASMATSFAGVTGFSFLLGMSTALDTMCGQAFGAKQYHMLGIHMQRAMLALTLVSLPVAVIWSYTGSILKLCGQDPEIATEAGLYARWMIPTIFAYGLLQCHVRFLQTQNIVFPMMLSTGVTALLHVLVCWLLVYKSGLGSKGAAVAISISYWTNVLLLALYVRLSPACKKTWVGFSRGALHDMSSFIKLAVPSATMVCLEFWSFELLVLLSGILPNPKLETSVLSISLNTASMVFMVPFGLGAAVSTRVSNELGAGHPQAASLAVKVVVFLAITEGLIVGLTMILARGIWGYAYSNVEEVVRYVAIMMPILATSNLLDGMQCVLSGVARGCGWQKIGALVNLGAYYIVGIPSAVLLAFVFHVGGKGLWMGIICGLLVQMLLFSAITYCTNWEKEVSAPLILFLTDTAYFNSTGSLFCEQSCRG
ncbi:MATE efflux family protein [Musa troglodytarum]|uniref:Protein DETOXIFICATION n=1 Tax=Musa troglodytarum TaxID=320322 RepID=A0A9E7JIK2_9LILI|nr:MATE efflux family protein [Musa troglodytarum]